MKRIESKWTEKRKTSEREKNRLFKLKKNRSGEEWIEQALIILSPSPAELLKQSFGELKPAHNGPGALMLSHVFHGALI